MHVVYRRRSPSSIAAKTVLLLPAKEVELEGPKKEKDDDEEEPTDSKASSNSGSVDEIRPSEDAVFGSRLRSAIVG